MKTEKISQVTIDTLNDQISEILGPPLKDQNIYLQNLLKHLDKINVNKLASIGLSKIDYIAWINDFIDSLAKMDSKTPYFIDDIENELFSSTNEQNSIKDINEFHSLCRLIQLLDSAELRLRTFCIFTLFFKISHKVQLPKNTADNITCTWIKYTLDNLICPREIALVAAFILDNQIPITSQEKKRGAKTSEQKQTVQIALAIFYNGKKIATDNKKEAFLFVKDEITKIVDYGNSHKLKNESLIYDPMWVKNLKAKSDLKISSAWEIYPESILALIYNYIQFKNRAIYNDDKTLKEVIKSILKTEHRATIDNWSIYIANTYLHTKVKIGK
ncbi:hypothetical protein [Proteus mirabilis]|uniref:hypothetical protein n=1 Tax=Proteus mirabilis TaxID=584 RepID=UPI00227F7ADC|nr:hypothetical protein [Proteus mirabilis]MCY9777577.1 hypothetical protein [Proteus mirabilis]MCY9780350.1 hypothetical protein [Proteus mirabilis]MCY9789199.1 hypothetical protein [Proteus mirabilis]